MQVPEIALAASTRQWPDRLHRFILDHGGARVTDRIMQPDQLSDTAFDVLIIDDISSVLSPGLVESVRRRGAGVVGVFEAIDGLSARRRLSECGISDLIEADADPSQFLSIVDACSSATGPPTAPPTPEVGASIVGVSGPVAGVGITEIAIGLAWSASKGASVVLVDLDPIWPSTAQRLDIDVHPNVRTTIDAILHRPAAVEESLQKVGRLSVAPGAPGGMGDNAVGRPDLVMLLESMGGLFELVVLDLGPLDRVPPGILRELDGLVIVGASDPVGVARLVRTVRHVHESHDPAPVLALVNRCPNGYRGAEIGSQLESSLPEGVSHIRVGNDSRLEEASWNGQMRQSRKFRRSMDRVSGVVLEARVGH